jgi:hypothetical protein
MLRKLANQQIEITANRYNTISKVFPDSETQSQVQIDLDWVEKTLQKLFVERNNKSIDSRIRL